MFLQLFGCLLLNNFAIAAPPVSLKAPSTIISQLQSAKIIPNVTDNFVPTIFPVLTWVKGASTQLGNTISVRSLIKRPSVYLYDPNNPNGCASSSKTYVVALTDPDSPSARYPVSSELCHWIVSNVPVSPTSGQILNLPHTNLAKTTCAAKPNEVIPYLSPSPGPKTGKHRYVVLVFTPKNGTTNPLNLSKPRARLHWGSGKAKSGARDWANANGLQVVGANFLFAQHENAY